MKFRCAECGKPAVRAYCLPAGPWTPYCGPEHGPGIYEPAGDISIERLPAALNVLQAVGRALETPEEP